MRFYSSGTCFRVFWTHHSSLAISPINLHSKIRLSLIIFWMYLQNSTLDCENCKRNLPIVGLPFWPSLATSSVLRNPTLALASSPLLKRSTKPNSPLWTRLTSMAKINRPFTLLFNQPSLARSSGTLKRYVTNFLLCTSIEMEYLKRVASWTRIWSVSWCSAALFSGYKL